MCYSNLVKLNGRWGVYSFSEGVKISPKAFSEKRFSEEDDAETVINPAETKDLPPETPPSA